ncbi:MAG: histidine kinase [Kiritimatiellales bacterium]
MSSEFLILVVESIAIYLLVLSAHSLRQRFGLAPFYALLGGITAVMSWITDAGVYVELAGIRFVVGSTVFYTSLLLGVFVVYVFDGPRATRIAILTVAGVSTIVPLIATILHLQMKVSDVLPLSYVPLPSLRINTASVVTTVLDLIFLAMAWEILGSPLIRANTLFRSFLTLLGVMWLDVVLFSTGAFLGTPNYLRILEGTLYSRLAICIFASPFLYGYLHWQSRKEGVTLERRPVLSILREVAEVRAELDSARREIERRQDAETLLRQSERRYRELALHADGLLETERSRIAAELHDEIGQILTALKIDLSAMERSLETQNISVSSVESMSALLDQSVLKVHRLCRSLRPGALDDLGLEAALKDLIEDWSERNPLDVESRVHIDSTNVSEKVSTAVYRIIQESLTNISRHAKASAVSIRVQTMQGELKFAVEDNGVGLPVDWRLGRFSFGLIGMQERVHLLNGVLDISGSPGKGVCVKGSIPLM